MEFDLDAFKIDLDTIIAAFANAIIIIMKCRVLSDGFSAADHKAMVSFDYEVWDRYENIMCWKYKKMKFPRHRGNENV
jgi:hypothetical protein